MNFPLYVSVKDKNPNYEEYKLEDFISDDSFINYIHNTDQSDFIKWTKWLALNPKNKDTAEEAKLLISHLRFKKQDLSSDFVNNEWLRLRNRLNLNKIKSTEKKGTIFIRRAWKYAAVLSISLFLASAIYYLTSKPKHNLVADYHEIIVPKGMIKKVILPDGSMVYINSDSKLAYSNFSGKGPREIFLEGEAYFSVKHDAKKPLIVHSENKEVIDLGTIFNIDAYPSDNLYRVTLERGLISVSNNSGRAVNLKENQTYLLVKSTNQSRVFETNNIKSYSAWKDGKIIFIDESFTNILRDLERSYNVTFILRNKKVVNYRYTGSFTKKDKISFILNVIKLTTPFKYKVLNDTIVIK